MTPTLGKVARKAFGLPLLFSRFRYYTTSLTTLSTGFSHPLGVLRLFAAWPRPHPARVRLRATDLQFNVRDALDTWVIKEVCLDRDYGGPAKQGWTVVDVGAGIGEFAVLCAAEGATVHAYEPDVSACRLLKENVALNQQTGIRCWNEPLSAESPPTLMTALDRLPSGYCDWLKLDCEGCEFDLILNSDAAVWARIGRISLEYHKTATRSHQALIGRLEDAGYRVTHRPNPVHNHLGFLFASRE